MLITTPSGFKVTVKDNFTYGDYRKIVKSFLKGSEVDLANSTKEKVEIKNMTADKFLEYQDYAFDVLIIKIVRDGKEILTGFKAEIDTWPISDGSMLSDEIGKVLQEVNKAGEKK